MYWGYRVIMENKMETRIQGSLSKPLYFVQRGLRVLVASPQAWVISEVARVAT